MFDFDMRDPCQDLENLSVSRFISGVKQNIGKIVMCGLQMWSGGFTKTDHV